MHVVSFRNSINIIVSAREGELLLEGLRALNEKHGREGTMTPQLKEAIVDAAMRIEMAILETKATKEVSEPKHKIFDFLSFND